MCETATLPQACWPESTGTLTPPLSSHRYVSCVLGCPYEGKIPPAKVAEVCVSGWGFREGCLAGLPRVHVPLATLSWWATDFIRHPAPSLSSPVSTALHLLLEAHPLAQHGG